MHIYFKIIKFDKSKFYLLVIPLLIFITQLKLLLIIKPFYAGLDYYDYDPSYIYLLTGVGLVQGYVPVHIDHPGVPLQFICGIISYISWLLYGFFDQRWLGFNASIMSNTEEYLFVCSLFLLFLNTFAIFYTGFRIKLTTNSILLSILAQAHFCLLGALLPRLFYVAPESVVIFSVAMSVSFLLDFIFLVEVDEQQIKLHAIVSGFFLALGTAAKITMAPLVLLLLVIPTRRGKLFGLISFILFLNVFLFPISPVILNFFTWIWLILTHGGIYGSGNQEFINLNQAFVNLNLLMNSYGIMFFSIFCVSITILFSSKKQEIVRTGLILIVVSVIQLLFVIKHFSFHYALPSFVLSSIFIPWSIRNLTREIDVRKFENLFAVFSLVVISFMSLEKTSYYMNNLLATSYQRDSDLSSMQNIIAQYSDPIVIGTYRARNIDAALGFASIWTSGSFYNRLSSGHVNLISYNRWSKKFQKGSATISTAYLNNMIKSGKNILLICSHDVDIPSIVGDILLEIPGREKIINLKYIGE